MNRRVNLRHARILRASLCQGETDPKEPKTKSLQKSKEVGHVMITTIVILPEGGAWQQYRNNDRAFCTPISHATAVSSDILSNLFIYFTDTDHQGRGHLGIQVSCTFVPLCRLWYISSTSQCHLNGEIQQSSELGK